MEIYAGSTPKLLVKIKDADGVQMDPEDADQIIDVRIKIYNAISGAIIAKFYLNAVPTPSTGWRQADVKVLSSQDKRLVLTLTAEETHAAPGNQNDIKVEVIVPDTDMVDSNDERTEVMVGHFPEIKHTKEEENG
jgi:hypothetical protein